MLRQFFPVIYEKITFFGNIYYIFGQVELSCSWAIISSTSSSVASNWMTRPILRASSCRMAWKRWTVLKLPRKKSSFHKVDSFIWQLYLLILNLTEGD